MKKLPIALTVLVLLTLAPGALAQVRPGQVGDYAVLSGSEPRFDWCPVADTEEYLACPYQDTISQFPEEQRCSAGEEEVREDGTLIITGEVHPQLCIEFTARYLVCPLDESQPCEESANSLSYVLLPDLDGDGVVGQGDYLRMLAEWGTRYGVSDFSCLAIWWGRKVPPSIAAPILTCPED